MTKITVSDQAQAYFRKIIKQQKVKNLAIRLTAINPGTPGAECGIQYCPAEFITPNDERFAMTGFDIVIDSLVSRFLDESELDLGKDDEGKEVLTFHAPNLNRDFLPENATLKEKVANFISTVVSPGFAGHGGSVTMTDMTDDGVVKVVFSGGCLGCSMVGVTLHDGVEAQLKQAFPGQIKEVVDVSEHVVTDETYG